MIGHGGIYGKDGKDGKVSSNHTSHFPSFPRSVLPAYRHRRRHGRLVLLAGPNPVNLVHVENEDLAVADIAGVCAAKNGLDGDIHERFGDADIDADLFLQLDFHRGAAIGLYPLGLTAVSEQPGYGENPALQPGTAPPAPR